MPISHLSIRGCLVSTLLAVALLSGCDQQSGSTTSSRDIDYYTCTMHPSVHSHDPKAKCPICSMDLEPVLRMETAPANDNSAVRGSAAAGFHEFTVPVERQQQIGVTYAPARIAPLHRTIRAVGTVATDLARHWEFVARFEGYVQKLIVTSPGEPVRKDQSLLSIYSPDLFIVERELVHLFNIRDREQTSDGKTGTASLIEGSRRRLAQWSITPQQIEELERTREAPEFITLHSPFDGVVEEVLVNQGRKVMPGDRLVSLADLSLVWVWAEFYENEIAQLAKGQKVVISSSSYPGEKFEGAIALVSPFVAEMRRTVRARLDIPNPHFKLHPGMFVTVELAVEHGRALTIPLSAVMPTGDRMLAFVDRGEGRLEPRSLQLGGPYSGLYEVLSGLKEGERVVASANFLIDAESKVQGAVKSFALPEADPADTPPASPEPVQLPPNATEVYQPMIESYLALKDSLAHDHPDALKSTAAGLEKWSDAVAKSGVLPSSDVPRYRERLAAFASSLKQFDSESLDEARVHFGKVSATLIALLTEFPPALAKPVYVMDCAMWQKSPGKWVQATPAIENPFMGQRMLECGELVKTLTTTR